MSDRRFVVLLHEILLASLSAPIALSSVACGGPVAKPAGAGLDAEPGDDATDSPSGTCSTPPLDGAAAPPVDGGCTGYSLPVIGDPAACGLVSEPASGAPCEALCHQPVVCCGFVTPGFVSCTIGNGCFCLGRRIGGSGMEPARGRGSVGRWFGELATREAASVAAFEILAAELVAHGAPGRLVRDARRAARDESRHARLMSDLASRYDGRPGRIRVRRRAVRSLETVAIDNAVEGCVRETYGALVGMWQARHAADPQVRRVMRGVGRDEGRHAALSWEIARWIEPTLDPQARERLEAAKSNAVDQLAIDIAVPLDPQVLREAGVPDGPSARRLFERARSILWSS